MRPRYTAIGLALLFVAWLVAHAMTGWMRWDPRSALINWPAVGLAWALMASTNWKHGRRPPPKRRRTKKRRRGKA